MDPTSTKDDLRGNYHQFVLSTTGADFLGKLATYELSLIAQAMLESDHEKKSQAIDKAAGIYWVRTLLQDLSKPKSEPKVATRASGTRRSGKRV